MAKNSITQNEESPDLLYNFGARYYAFWFARFMSPDPDNAGASSDDPQSWNMYAYGRDNPVIDTDPDGRACVQQSDGSWADDNSGGQSCADANADNNNGGYHVTIDGTTPDEKKQIQIGEEKQFFSDLTLGILQPIARNGWQALGIQNQRRFDAFEAGAFVGLSAMALPEEGSVNSANQERTTHILDGDATGGGHAPGTGISGKSEFPASWSRDKIMNEISDVATDPASKSTQQGRDTVVEGTREGINIRVVIRNGNIWAAYPTDVPRNL